MSTFDKMKEIAAISFASTTFFDLIQQFNSTTALIFNMLRLHYVEEDSGWNSRVCYHSVFL